MSGRDDRRQGSLEVVLVVLVALPLFYVLSIGPVVKASEVLHLEGDWLRTVYTPLIYAHQHTPMKEPLDRYLALWGVR